jgi:1-acyl-sn-glycerol-3-phosphate acyltransferase
MWGRVAGVYTHEQLKAMPAEEVNRLIARDLFEDAWERQRRECVPYRGRDLARNLETLLCLCPHCGRIGTLKSEGDRFFCDCGLNLRYSEYGYFEGEIVPFKSVYEWDAWQTERLFALWHGNGQEPLFTDTEIRLKEVLPGHRSRELGVGELRLYRDRLECCGMAFPLSEIGAINLMQTQIIAMSFGPSNFEMDTRPSAA